MTDTMPWSVVAVNAVVKLPPVASIASAALVVLHGKHWGYFVTFVLLALCTNQTLTWSYKSRPQKEPNANP